MARQMATDTYYRSSFTPLAVAWMDDIAKLYKKAQASEEPSDYVLLASKSLAVLAIPTAETKNLVEAAPYVEEGDFASALWQAWGGK